MTDQSTIRKWPLVLPGLVLVVTFATLFAEQPQLQLESRSLPPGPGHWLGTDGLGRDVWLSLLVGARRSMMISVGAALFGGIIGVAIGSISAFFGNDRLLIPTRNLITLFFSFLLIVYSVVVLVPVGSARGKGWLSLTVFLALVLLLLALWYGLKRLKLFGKRVSLPLDTATQRFTEVFSVIPRLYLVIVFAMVVPINMVSLIILFAITGWDVMSRLIRAEMLKVREMTFIESARIIGLPEWRVFFKHALPNAIGPVATQVCFTISGLLIAEATLSFIGIGISPEVVSWGSIIHGYLENLQAWWLALFPGIVIYLTVISLHALGADLDKAYHGKYQL